jgi:hypothetical protein
LEGEPQRAIEALQFGNGPEHPNVDAFVGLAIVPKRPCDPAGRVFGVSRLEPRPDAALKRLDDLIGNAGVDVGAGGGFRGHRMSSG